MSEENWAKVEEIPSIVERARNAFNTDRSRSVDFRIQQLRRLRAFMTEKQSQILGALDTDLKKTYLQSMLTEINPVIDDIDLHISHLHEWTKPQSRSVPAAAQPASAYVIAEPYGLTLIIGPWNYPFRTVLLPLIGAISAGNAVIIKPSEVSPASSKLLATGLGEYLDKELYPIVEGGIPQSTELLRQRFDYILYTGNSEVGKIIMREASKYLTPVTLELGGKSPVFVDRSCDLDVTARRIAWGKFMNAGQTCVAPDYILANKDVSDALTEKLKKVLTEFYGDDAQKSTDYTRIINERHVQRIKRYLDNQEVVFGGQVDEQDRFIAPTIVKDPKPDSLIMKEEIFGPLLPIISVENTQEAIDYVNQHEKPLSLYIFSSDKQLINRIIQRTSAGGVCINDTVMQTAVDTLHFGGVGYSGMGSYNGKATFDTFSHYKPVMDRWTGIDPSIRYPPYTDSRANWVLRLTRPLPTIPTWFKWAVCVAITASIYYKFFN